MGNNGGNRYLKSAHILEVKFREMLRCFSLDITAAKTSEIHGYIEAHDEHSLQEAQRDACNNEFPHSGEVDVDESYFGARRIKAKRGRGSYGKTIVFGILERSGKVYAEIVSDCSRATLHPIIRSKVEIESVVCSDEWRGYIGLVVADIGYSKHFRVDHRENNLMEDHI
jgi:transposase